MQCQGIKEAKVKRSINSFLCCLEYLGFLNISDIEKKFKLLYNECSTLKSYKLVN